MMTCFLPFILLMLSITFIDFHVLNLLHTPWDKSPLITMSVPLNTEISLLVIAEWFWHQCSAWIDAIIIIPKVHNFILLWLAEIHDQFSILLTSSGFFGALVQSILENVPCAYEKKVYLVAVGWNVLCMLGLLCLKYI
jgi:hypothetical protein